MLIKIPKPWECAGLRPVDESVYMNRRTAIKAIGAGAVAMALGCDTQGPGAIEGIIGGLEAKTEYKPTTLLNKKYMLDRSITDREKVLSFNNFYEFSLRKTDVRSKSKNFVISPWKVEIGGLVKKPQTLDIDDIRKSMPMEERLYRFRCVEAWAMAVPWLGFPFTEIIKRVEPLPSAAFVKLVSFYRPKEAPNQRFPGYSWPYQEGLTIEEAMNELTFLATGLYGHPLEKQNGAPIRLVVPWKYGFKNIKSIVKIEFVRNRPYTFWNRSAPREYGFTANVNPNEPHPRWSQETEKLIDTGRRVDTVLFNGYGDYVDSLYPEL